MVFTTVVFILFKDWRNQLNRYYAFFASTGFGILLMMFLQYTFPESPHLTQLNRISQLSTVLCFAGLFGLSLVFPKGDKGFPFIYTSLMLLPAFIMGYVAGFTDLTITRAYFKGDSLIRDFRFYYTVYAIVAFVYLLLAIINFIRKYVKTKVEIYRRQMRFVFIGTSVAVFFAAIFSIALPRIYNYTDMYVLGASVAGLLSTFSLYYSIISYQMMDITTAIHKTTMYIIISMIIFLPIYGIIAGHEMNIWNAGEFPTIVIAGSAVLVFLLFSNYLQPLIDRAFRRRQYEFENILDNFIRDVEVMRDFKSLIEKSVDILYDSLFLKNSFFIIYNSETRQYEPFYRKGEEIDIAPLARNATVIRWFIRNREILHLDRIYTDERSFGEIRDDFIEFFSRNRVKLIMPMYHGQRLLGLLCLGDKDSLAAFKPDELEKLQYFHRESNIHISNALSYEEAMREQMRDRTIELSSDIMSKSIPVALPNLMGIKFGVLLIPKYGEGVDYFDFLRPGNQGIGVLATDISGMGVKSALNSVILRSSFQACVNESPSTFSVMQRLNRILYEYTEGGGELITAFYLYYDIKSMRLIYTNAGFPALEIYRIGKNDFDSLDTEGIPLGHDPRGDYGMGRTNLLRGDIGVLFSKALINSKNQKGEYFEIGQLRALVKENRGNHPNDIAQIINDSFSRFIGLSSPESDVVVIVFKIV